MPPAKRLSPRHVVERQLAAIAQRDWAGMAALYAADAVVELPFNLPAPLRLEGRQQLEARNAAARQLPLELRPANVVVHETTDPEVVVAEFDYHARVTTTGRTFSVPNVIIMRVRDGKIVASRDYHHHAAIDDALGELAELIRSGPAST